MGGWDYRVVKRKSQLGDAYVIYEVSFDDAGVPQHVSSDPILPVGEDLDDLKSNLKWMLEAIENPLFELPEVISDKVFNPFVHPAYNYEASEATDEKP